MRALSTKPPRKLESLLRLWLLGYGATLFVIFAILLPLIALQIEDELFVQQLIQEAARISHLDDEARAPFRLFRGDDQLPRQLAPLLRDLPPGIHELDDVDIPDLREGFVLIEDEPGRAARRYLVYDVSQLEVLDSLAHPYFSALILAGAGLALIVVLGGLFAIRRVVSNLERLGRSPVRRP